MAENLNLGDTCCCKAGISGLRKLTFPDGSQVGIIGLDTVMEDLYRQGKSADGTIGSEMIERLKKQNYLAPSALPTYETIFLSEYKYFLEMKFKSNEKENQTMANQENNKDTKKKGIFNLFKSDKKTANEGGCCNMKIVPKDQPAKESTKGGCCSMKIVPKEQAADNKNTK
jgi:hypothetical protein